MSALRVSPRREGAHGDALVGRIASGAAVTEDRFELQVLLVDRLHLAVGGRSLCGRARVAPEDVYPDEAGLRAWNAGVLERCGQCVRGLAWRGRGA